MTRRSSRLRTKQVSGDLRIEDAPAFPRVDDRQVAVTDLVLDLRLADRKQRGGLRNRICPPTWHRLLLGFVQGTECFTDLSEDSKLPLLKRRSLSAIRADCVGVTRRFVPGDPVRR